MNNKQPISGPSFLTKARANLVCAEILTLITFMNEEKGEARRIELLQSYRKLVNKLLKVYVDGSKAVGKIK